MLQNTSNKYIYYKIMPIEAISAILLLFFILSQIIIHIKLNNIDEDLHNIKHTTDTIKIKQATNHVFNRGTSNI